MGMDVYGRAPSEEEGEYFRSSIWYWPSILAVIAATGVLPESTVEGMAYNDGYGPDTPGLAEQLADALETLVKGMDDDAVLETTHSPYSESGTAAAARLVVTEISPNDAPQFTATVRDIREFAEFSRYSGGFAVC